MDGAEEGEVAAPDAAATRSSRAVVLEIGAGARPKEGDEGGSEAMEEKRWTGEVGTSCLPASKAELGEVGTSKASSLLRWKNGDDEVAAPRGEEDDEVGAARGRAQGSAAAGRLRGWGCGCSGGQLAW